jgi:pyruvate dehydrogenase E1 component alpha subunit
MPSTGSASTPPISTVPERLDDDNLLTIYTWLLRLRAFDERAVALQRQGRIGTYPPFWGEEATQVGPLFACRDEDWVFPSYRQNAIGILRGLPPSVPLLYRRGLGGDHGFWNPRRFRVAPICIPIATHIPHAVGLAMAARIRGEPVCSLVWFGDGATSEGDFHEALNFAAVFKAPIVFFCVNNQWAISTPFERQTATASVAEKAAAYGVPGVGVDGFDVLACFEAARAALDRARSGNGPTLVEALCYRLGPHATADDPSLYRDPAEADRYRASEPLVRTRALLHDRGLLTEERDRVLHAEAAAAMTAAVAELDAVPDPGPEILFDTLYSSGRPWTLDEGFDVLRSRSHPESPFRGDG